jgi:redox-sensing transcriptional repressor
MEAERKQETKKPTGVPEPTIRRMPLYHNLLKKINIDEVEYISAPLIARILNLDPTQVVKDLSYTGIIGKTRVGYKIVELIIAIENLLGFHHPHDAFLVGAGNLGFALLNYTGFKPVGMNIIAAFDTDRKKIGTLVQDVKIYDFERYREMAEKMKPAIGIITTPPSVAQQVADVMVVWGIKAIWNYTQVSLRVPPSIVLQDTHIYASLAVIINKLNKEK